MTSHKNITKTDVDTLSLANIQAKNVLITSCVKSGYTEVHACTPVARTYRLQMGNTERLPHTAKPHPCKRSNFSMEKSGTVMPTWKLTDAHVYW